MSPHETHGIPWRELIVPQVVNFALFFGLLVYFLKKPLRAHFNGKTTDFEDKKRLAEDARRQAEQQNFEVRNLLRVLDESSGQSIEDAERDARTVKNKIIDDTNENVRKMADEAEQMVQFEYQRAIANLREEFVLISAKIAEQNLRDSVDGAVQAHLNAEFIEKVKTVAK